MLIEFAGKQLFSFGFKWKITLKEKHELISGGIPRTVSCFFLFLCFFFIIIKKKFITKFSQMNQTWENEKIK